MKKNHNHWRSRATLPSLSAFVFKCLVLLCLLHVSLPSFSTIWYVNNASTCGGTITQPSCPTDYICPTGCGQTWATAFSNLHCAFSSAQSGDEIWVAAGTYVPNLYKKCEPNTNALIPYAMYRIPSGVAIYGGFDGTETLRGERDWEANETIISGDRGVQGDASDNVVTIIQAYLTSPGTILDGFFIQDGDGTNGANWTYTGGAGLSVSQATLEVKNTTFRRNNSGTNASIRRGGALLVKHEGILIMEGCIFDGNTGIEGGAVTVADDSKADIVNCIFINNTGKYGGAITSWNNAGNTNIVNCTFYNNESTGTEGGGAIFNIHGVSPRIHNSIFFGNVSSDNSAIANKTGSYLSDMSITNNTMITVTASTPVVNNSITQTWNTGTSLQVGTDPGFQGTTSPAGADGLFGTPDDDFIATSSSVIDAGNNAVVIASGVTVDVSENDRIVDNVVDLGIYESGTNLPQIPSGGTVWYVKPSTYGNCSGCFNNLELCGKFSWGCALNSLEVAFDSAKAGDEIWMMNGTYSPVRDVSGSVAVDPQDATFMLPDSVAIYGGFLGTESYRHQRDPEKWKTYLEGDIGVASQQTDNLHHIVTAQNLGNSLLDGVIIRNAYLDDGSATITKGAGMVVDGGYASVRNCVFMDNQAAGFSPDGGGLACISGSVSVFDCEFTDNVAISAGGAMYFESATVDLERNVFNGNEGSSAGAIFATSTSLNADQCRFTDQYVGDGSSCLGGESNAIILTNTIFHENQGNGPVVIIGQGGDGDLVNCVFHDNDGTALLYEGSDGKVVNCTFSDNASGVSAPGGIKTSGSSVVDITNCVFWGNTSNFGSIDITCGGTCNTSYTYTQTSVSGTGNVQGLASPFADASAAFGSDFMWGTPDDGLHLDAMAGASAMDAGNDMAVLFLSDIAGNDRIQGVKVDMGAYEGTQSCVLDDTLHVDADANGFATGACWDHAFPTLYDAIDALTTYTEVKMIKVAAGTYYPTGGPYNGDNLIMKDSVIYQGGYEYDPVTSTETFDIQVNETILSGNIGDPAVNTDNSMNVLRAIGTNVSAVADGFTIQEGNAYYSPNRGGAGVHVTDGSATIRNCLIKNNIAPAGPYGEQSGAGAKITGANPVFENCVFENNTASNGGAVSIVDSIKLYYVWDAQLAQYVWDTLKTVSGPTFKDCNFSNNASTIGSGGAIHVRSRGKQGRFENCTFENNIAETSGGAIFFGARARLWFVNCQIRGNTAGTNGGGLEVDGKDYYDEARPYFLHCVFDSNMAVGSGGAVSCLDNGSPDFRGVIFHGNSAAQGGAAYNSRETEAFYTNCTFYGNEATNGSGGGMLNDLVSKPRVNNSIFWANTATASGVDIHLDGTGDISLGYSMTQAYVHSSPATNQVNVNPQFLMDNSGSINSPVGPNGIWGDSDDGLQLYSSSTAVDAGADVWIPSRQENDFADGSRIQKAAVDLGPYESAYGTAAPDVYPSNTEDLQIFLGCETNVNYLTDPSLSTVKSVTDAEFGATTQGGDDDTEAFIKAAEWLNTNQKSSNPTKRLVLEIPAGVYEVGFQLAVNNSNYDDPNDVDIITGDDYPGAVNDIQNTSMTFMGIDIFHLKDVERVSIIGEEGAQIIFNDGMRFGGWEDDGAGGYDPVTQLVGSGTPAPKGASLGQLFFLEDCECVQIEDLELDGDLANQLVGGAYRGADEEWGIQLSFDAVSIMSSQKIGIDNVNAHHMGRDGVGVFKSYAGDQPEHIVMRDLKSEYNGRQGLSWTSGRYITALNSSFSYTGRGGYKNNPGAGIDIEPEGGLCHYGNFKNCELLDNWNGAMVSDATTYWPYGWRVSNIDFEECTFWAPLKVNDCSLPTNQIAYNSTYVMRPTGMRNTSFTNCDIYGALWFVSGSDPMDYITFDGCLLSDKGPDGKEIHTICHRKTMLEFGTNMIDYRHVDIDDDDVIDYSYYNWDNAINGWFAFNNCVFDMYFLSHNYMEGMSELGSYSNDVIMAEFNCNTFNLHTKSLFLSLQNHPNCINGEYGVLGGRSLSTAWNSNTFIDLNPGNSSILSEIDADCDSRYWMHIDLRNNTSDGNNKIFPASYDSNIYDNTLQYSRMSRRTNINSFDTSWKDF